MEFKIKNKIFTIISIILISGLLASISSYAQSTPPYTKNSEKSTITLSDIDDPDGDGDTRGSKYFPKERASTGNKVFIFDPNYRAWAAYNTDGHRVNTGKASGGADYCPDVGRTCRTISGVFKIFREGGPDCASSKYPLNTGGGAPMPYCMHFSRYGYAIHGSSDIPNRNASHGCIRVTPTVAKWLNQKFMEIGTTVIILPYKK